MNIIKQMMLLLAFSGIIISAEPEVDYQTLYQKSQKELQCAKRLRNIACLLAGESIVATAAIGWFMMRRDNVTLNF